MPALNSAVFTPRHHNHCGHTLAGSGPATEAPPLQATETNTAAALFGTKSLLTRKVAVVAVLTIVQLTLPPGASATLRHPAWLADNTYDIASVSSTLTWFGDGSLRNSQMPREAYNGATPYMKFWWFDKS
jgi:hypothetical protein